MYEMEIVTATRRADPIACCSSEPCTPDTGCMASKGCSKGLITSATATTGTSKTTATRTSCRSGGASHTLVVDAHGHVGEAQRERGRSTGGEREAHTCWPSLACRPRALVLQAITLDAVTGCV